MKKPKKEEKPLSGAQEAYEWLQILIVALVTIILVFTFVGRIIGVDGSSMYPTLHHGDMLLLQSVGYEPKQGDVVVLTKAFRDVDGPIVKRVIAVGGQTVDIDYDAGTVAVDGQVLDEPSIGLHPSNIEGLRGVMHDLIADGNSIVLVDHDTEILRDADWLIEMGPGAGENGGTILTQGTVEQVAQSPASRIGPFLADLHTLSARTRTPEAELFALGTITLRTRAIHTVKPLEVRLPKGRLIAVTGVSGSGKTTLVLESLIPALEAAAKGEALPAHVESITAPGIAQVKLIDATPIGINVRSTVATYANVHDELRKIYARSPLAREKGYKAGDFSYNTGRLRCPGCDGTGTISLDIQFLPDVEITCPDCGGSRYQKDAAALYRTRKDGTQAESLPRLMEMSVDEALAACADLKLVASRLQTLSSLGLGYLTLGEATPSLSGGEAQRLKLASEMGKGQADTVFVFDEPTIGLHPLDVRTLLGVFQRLIDSGATVVVIEHDLDVIRNADYLVDLGPGGGESGGRIVACGTPEQVAADPASITGKYLHL